jgi:hypothetical protein
MHFGDRQPNRLDHALRSNSPQARDAFVAELAARIPGTERPRRSVPRLAAALAVTVVLAATVAAFGGLSYAGTAFENTASSALHTIKQVANSGNSRSSSPSSHQFKAPSVVYPTLSCAFSFKHSSYVEVFGHTSDPTAGPIFVTVTWDSGQPYGSGTASANHSSHHWSTNIHGTHNQPGTTYTATATQDGSTTTCTGRRPGHHHHHHHDYDHNYG